MSRRNTYLISFPKQKHSSTWKVYTSRPRSITGQYTKSITHHVDTYGRNVGYSIDAIRQNTLSYDPATGRMAGMNASGDFTWDYLANTDLKSKLTYPNGATAEWAYEPKRNLLTQVKNTVINPQVISQYDYTHDAIARRTAMGKSGIMMSEADTINYGYNARNEVILADAAQDADYLFNYTFDDIGNRITGENKAYTANTLNQYTAIGSFTPTYDANGNQTLVQTTTGTWTVAYNGENRPITWTQDTTTITMEYDYAGRRISYKKMQGDALVSHTKFLYKGFLCVQQLSADAPWNVLKAFIWDPTEATATRPLIFTEGEQTTFYMHDGNKNVTDVISSTASSSDVTHYDYAPFGAVVRAVSADISTHNSSPITHNSELRSDNPFRFSSEYHDDDLGLIYYNYRHYNPTDGRWMNRDPNEEEWHLYTFCINNPIMKIDLIGLITIERCNLLMERAMNDAIVQENNRKLKAEEKKGNKKCTVLPPSCICCSKELGVDLGGIYVSPPESPFIPEPVAFIRLCANNHRYSNPDSILETLRHEFVHAWRFCKGEDFSTCEARICEEIEAYFEDESCRPGGSNRSHRETKRECVVRMAARSVHDFCNFNPFFGLLKVDALYDSCRDPF